MRNLNTKKFWNKAFESEWNIMQSKAGGSPYSKETFYRFEGDKFDAVAKRINFTGKLLDIGCGLGHFCRFIKARNPFLDITGVDFSDIAISKAKILDNRIKFVEGDIYNLPFPDKTFDFITSLETIEHLETPEKAIQEWKRVLNPGGTLVMTTPWKGIVVGENGLGSEEHIQEWTPKEFEVQFRKYFKKIESWSLLPLFDGRETKLIPRTWFIITCKI